MPRTKSTAKRGNHQAASRGGRRGNANPQSSFVPFKGTFTPERGHNGFTLQQEARNTGRQDDSWSSDKKLRFSKVDFVSAGTLEPSIPKDAEAAMARMTLDEDDQVMTTLEDDDGVEPAYCDPVQPEKPSSQEMSTLFVIDTQGSIPVHTGLPAPNIRASSPTPSNSSEEIILFRGRDHAGKVISRASSAQRAPTTLNTIDRKIRVVEDKIHDLEEVLHPAKQPIHLSLAPPAEPFLDEEETRTSKKSKRRHKQNNKSMKKIEEDAIIADYLENMSEDELDMLKRFGQRELGGDYSASDAGKDTAESSNEAKKVNDVSNSEWGPSDICDFDDLSTSDGVMGEVQAILSRRDRESGIQYLVVWQDQDVDEARWVPSTTLTSEMAMVHIAEFEEAEKLVPEYTGTEDDDDSDSTEGDFVDGVIEVEEDVDQDSDEDRVPQEIPHMSDEKIARLLAKQEELGMGSAELLLFDHGIEDDEEDDMNLAGLKFNPIMAPSRSKSKSNGTGSKRGRGDFPSATRLADAYDGFDVMDFERPSLRKKPKGRKGKKAFDLSDSELEETMQMSWENDRMKKKERRQEREELRAQGLLGSKNGKADMKQKYQEGMGIHAVKEEIKIFLMGADTTLALPPMDKKDRKVVHELANAFNLKSKSAGNGTKRFPILYRTRNTSVFTERAFSSVEARISRKFFPRMDKHSGGAVRRAGTGGGFSNAAVSYRDGDVVGGSAPELGVENKGRAMLEKMGWSSGTALGALNNKGILQPVSHVVKTTKAGLG